MVDRNFAARVTARHPLINLRSDGAIDVHETGSNALASVRFLQEVKVMTPASEQSEERTTSTFRAT
jgi:hypothetical protein